MPDLPVVSLFYTSKKENKYIVIVKCMYCYPLLGAVNWLFNDALNT